MKSRHKGGYGEQKVEWRLWRKHAITGEWIKQIYVTTGAESKRKRLGDGENML